MEYPMDFRCPISMELMREPVTICTGVTYERNNIHKWFYIYNKRTCPATMQPINSFDMTPNHTLKRLIEAWLSDRHHHQHSTKHDDLVSLLSSIGSSSSPFKVTSLRKLRSIVEMSDDTKGDFIGSGGVHVLVQILVQILYGDYDCYSSSDDFFITFRGSEEALAILHQLPVSSELSKPESMRSMALLLQKGSAEARLHVVTILKNMGNNDWNFIIQDQGTAFFKSLLELISDEICTKASSCALELLIQLLMTSSSSKTRLKAIEAGAVCVLIELLPDASTRSRCERILHLLKLLCECPEGRVALVDHHMGIPAISKTLLHVSTAATKMAVKVIWLVCNFHPTHRVLEDMLVYGSVKKLFTLLLHSEDEAERTTSSTKRKVLNMFKSHAKSWSTYPCFPIHFNDYLGLAT